MNKLDIFFSMFSLVVIGVLIVSYIGYSFETGSSEVVPRQSEVEEGVASETGSEQVVEQKRCSCCAERTARIRELIRKARERRQAEKATVVTQTPH